MTAVDIRKVGVQFSKPALVLTYYSSKTDKTRRRTIPVKNIDKSANLEDVLTELRCSKTNGRFIEAMSKLQVMKMLGLIKDHLNGLSLDESLTKIEEREAIHPDEDLNKADDDTLAHKKAAMEQTFLANQKKPGDDDFQYEIEVDFANDALETMNWSDDDDDFGF